MTKYIDGGYVDLDTEVVEINGRRLTEAEAAEWGERIAARGRRPQGRPSLTAPGRKSPTVNARVSEQTKEALRKRASREGVRESELVRRAVEELLAR